MSSLPPSPPRAAAPPPAPVVTSSGSIKRLPVPPSVLLKRRTALLAGAVAAITIAGTLFGATIKSEQQAHSQKAIQRRIEIDAAAQLEMLESSRARLLREKTGLENKIVGLHERQRTNAEKEKEREKMAETRRGLLGK